MKILIVCLGNICRSPLAAAILESYVANFEPQLKESLFICSAGTFSHTQGRPADSRVMKVALKNENMLSGVSKLLNLHKARPVSIEDIKSSDFILVMDLNNFSKIRRIIKESTPDDYLFNQMLKKMFLFGNFSKSTLKEGEVIIIEDPWYGNDSDFDLVYNQCYLSSKGFIDYVKNLYQ